MSPEQMQAWIQVTGLLVHTGIATFAQVRSTINGFHKDMTDEQMDAIVNGVIEDATRRKALAEREAHRS